MIYLLTMVIFLSDVSKNWRVYLNDDIPIMLLVKTAQNIKLSQAFPQVDRRLIFVFDESWSSSMVCFPISGMVMKPIPQTNPKNALWMLDNNLFIPFPICGSPTWALGHMLTWRKSMLYWGPQTRDPVSEDPCQSRSSAMAAACCGTFFNHHALFAPKEALERDKFYTCLKILRMSAGRPGDFSTFRNRIDGLLLQSVILILFIPCLIK